MINVKLKQILEAKNITGKQLATATGIRPNAISEILNNQRTTINRDQVSKIMKYLEIEDFNEIFELD